MTRIGTPVTIPMDPAVPYPMHVRGIKSWASTKIKLKKWRNKELSYHEFITKAIRLRSCPPKSQAPDLAAFLKQKRVDVFLGATTAYRRELMNVDYDVARIH